MNHPEKMKQSILFFSLCLILFIHHSTANACSLCTSNTLIEVSDDQSKAVKKTIRLEHPASIPFEQINEWLRKELEVGEHTHFIHQSTFSDKIGFTHHKYHQTYKGYPVQDGVFIIHAKGDEIRSANGEFYPGIKLSIDITIKAKQIFEISQRSVTAEIWAYDQSNFPKPEVYIISTKDAYRCAYKADINAYEPMTRKWLFVDTQTGETVAERNRINHFTVPGEAHCFYHGVQTIQVDSLSPSEFMLRDYSRGDGIITRNLMGEGDLSLAVDFVDDDNIWDTTTDLDNSALDVHWATGLMYDYMLNVHGWDSYDNQGSVVNCYIHHSNSFNANWNGSGMFFGDGDGSSFGPFTAAEVVGHEFMHGYSSAIVNWNSGNLEANSLNESFSDIFSVIVEFNTNPVTANYFIGDMITISGMPLRNMEDPKSLNAPDTYLGDFWSTFRRDVNANVFNHAFYLLTQGGSGTNDNGDDYSVSPISLSDAADILFRAMSVYMLPNTNFADARTHGIQACRDLFGPCSEQEIQYTNACYAVGIGSEYAAPPMTQIQFAGDTLVNEVINFSSNATNASNWNWSFGDNTTSSEEMPMHSYQTMGTYQVILSATYPGGCVMNDTFFISITGVTAIIDLEDTEILIYPNPARKHIFVEYPQGHQLAGIRVMNTLGQTMDVSNQQNLSDRKYEVDLKELPAGIYLLELMFDDRPAVFKKFYLSGE